MSVEQVMKYSPGKLEAKGTGRKSRKRRAKEEGEGSEKEPEDQRSNKAFDHLFPDRELLGERYSNLNDWSRLCINEYFCSE